MTQLWWVRHAPTHSKKLIGWSDIDADFSDTKRFEQLNKSLPQNSLLVASDLKRTSQTASLLEGAGRNRLSDHKGLREINFGDWDGLDFNEIAQKWPQQSQNYWKNPGMTTPTNGESWQEVENRVFGTIQAIKTQYNPKHIIIVSHFGAILTQYAKAARLTPHDAISYKINCLSVTKIDIIQNQWQAKYINCMEI